MIGLGSDKNMNYERAVLTIEAVKSKKELRASVRFRPSLQNTGMSIIMIFSIMIMIMSIMIMRHHRENTWLCFLSTYQQVGLRPDCQTSAQKRPKKLKHIVDKQDTERIIAQYWAHRIF